MREHKGFTLVELVVVVMILGILAAVAAPKLLGTTAAATENSLRQTLSVVRDAIERYAAENGGDVPADPAADLIPKFLRTFPVCPVGNKTADVLIVNDGDLTPGGDDEGWLYDTISGAFIVNSTDTDSTGETGYNTY